jgi:transposase InsO family protein
VLGSVFIGIACFVLGWIARGAIADQLPGLLISTHKRAYRLWWRWLSRRRIGRPALDPQLIELIRQISADNPLWGAPRIHGELLKLGFRVAQSTVSKYMLPRRGRPGQSWNTFVRNHTADIVAVDLFAVATIGFERLYAFVILAHGARKLLHIEIARRPSAIWLAQALTMALKTNKPALKLLIRDNDRLYGQCFRTQVRALGLDDRPTQPASPWQNGHVERLIGSIRRECLDHMVILNAAHLRRVLNVYADYYNQDRTHLALGKDCPSSRPIERVGAIRKKAVLGGLHHRYARSS